MTETIDRLNHDWPLLWQRLCRDYAELPEADRLWLAARQERIARGQEQLDALFRAVGGPEFCADCDGACCGAGRHHLTLANLLSFLLSAEDPPLPNYAGSCPYLGDNGCRLAVAHRPYNCISFFCEQLDARLSPEQRCQLQEVDRTLREAYAAIAARHPAGSLQGLLLAAERLGAGPLLKAMDPDVVE